MSRLCHVSKTVSGECDNCRTLVASLHMPEYIHGWYCERCCPVCRQSRKRRAA